MVNLISKPEVFEDDYQGDGRRFYTDGRKVHRYLRDKGETEAEALETLAQRSRDNGRTPMQWDAAPGAPLRPYEALVLER